MPNTVILSGLQSHHQISSVELKIGENVEFHRGSGMENKVFRDAMCIVGVSARNSALL
jgi:hypothetical protein